MVASPLTTHSTVSETLSWLNSKFTTHDSRFTISNDCFVDYVEDRQTGCQTEMMCAGRWVAERVGQDETLCGKSDNDYYQHEYTVIDRQFPYPLLTLKQIGIPAWDVLHVRTEYGDYYVEMGDERRESALLHQKV